MGRQRRRERTKKKEKYLRIKHRLLAHWNGTKMVLGLDFYKDAMTNTG